MAWSGEGGKKMIDTQTYVQEGQEHSHYHNPVRQWVYLGTALAEGYLASAGGLIWGILCL